MQEYILINNISRMGVIIFCVLLLNVIGQICGGNSNWGE